MCKTDLGYHWRSDPRLRLPSALYLTPKQAQTFNNILTMPVLLLYGKNGFVYKYPVLKDRISDCKHFKIQELDGGHHLHMEYPQQVSDAICAFMKQL